MSYNEKTKQYEGYIKTYNSVKEAGETLKIKPSCISSALTGKYKTAGGFIWKYAEDGEINE